MPPGDNTELKDGVGLAILAAAVRLPLICQANYSADEAFSFYVSRLDLAGIRQGLMSDRHPPLHYWLLHLIGLLGNSEAWMRLPSLLFDIVSVLMVSRITRRIGGSRLAALVAGGAVAVFYSFWFLDTQARMFPMGQCLQLVGTALLVDLLVLERRTWATYIGYVVSMVLACSTLYLAGLILIGQGVAALALGRKARGPLLAIILVGVLSLPAAYFMLLQLQAGNRETFMPGVFLVHLSTLYTYFLGLPTLWQALTHVNLGMLMLNPGVLVLNAAVSAALLWWQASVGRRLLQANRPGGLLILCIGLCYLVFLFGGNLLSQAFNLRDRYVFLVQPYMAVLLGLGLAELAPANEWGFAGLLGAVNLVLLGAYLTTPFLWLFDFKTLSDTVRQRQAAGDEIVLYLPSNYIAPFEYYYARDDFRLVKYQGDVYAAEPTGAAYFQQGGLPQYFVRSPQQLQADLPRLAKAPHVWYLTSDLGDKGFSQQAEVRQVLLQRFTSSYGLDLVHSYGLYGIDHFHLFELEPRP